MVAGFFIWWGGFMAVVFTMDALGAHSGSAAIGRLSGVALGLGAMFIGARLL